MVSEPGCVTITAVLQALTRKVLNVDGSAARIQNLPKLWRVSSTCSGAGNFELAMNAVSEALSEANQGLNKDIDPFEARCSEFNTCHKYKLE